MTERPNDVRKHYASPVIVERILAELASQGHDASRLTPELVYPFDQLHGRELEATRDDVARLGAVAGMRVLDVGSGIGGPARYIAATTGARVTGIDLTGEFVAAARDLTMRCGLGDKIDFHEGDALRMPFAEGRFDAALCLYVAMNIEAKAKLAGEIARVLRPGGRLVWSQVVLGPNGAPPFPQPWASAPEFSFLTLPEELRAAVAGAGFEILEWTDETAIIVDWLRQRKAAAAAGAKPRSALDLALGADFTERRNNYAQGLAEGRLGSILLVAGKPT